MVAHLLRTLFTATTKQGANVTTVVNTYLPGREVRQALSLRTCASKRRQMLLSGNDFAFTPSLVGPITRPDDRHCEAAAGVVPAGGCNQDACVRPRNERLQRRLALPLNGLTTFPLISLGDRHVVKTLPEVVGGPSNRRRKHTNTGVQRLDEIPSIDGPGALIVGTRGGSFHVCVQVGVKATSSFDAALHTHTESQCLGAETWWGWGDVRQILSKDMEHLVCTRHKMPDLKRS